MTEADSSTVERAVARCLSRRREVAAGYVFGSVARRKTRRDSDVDVAVLLAHPLRSSRLLPYRLKLMTELGSALHRSDVEVVVLNDASPLLAHRILSKGRLVFERSASARVRFQVSTASRYNDLIPMFETHIRYMKRRVREGRIIG